MCTAVDVSEGEPKPSSVPSAEAGEEEVDRDVGEMMGPVCLAPPQQWDCRLCAFDALHLGVVVVRFVSILCYL